MAFCFDQRYLSVEETDLVQCAITDLDRFVTRDDNVKRALIFPPIDSSRRYLLHRTVEEYYPQLCTFSIGEPPSRRPVVAFVEQLASYVCSPITMNVSPPPSKCTSSGKRTSSMKAPPLKRQRLMGEQAHKKRAPIVYDVPTAVTDSLSVVTDPRALDTQVSVDSTNSPRLACEGMAERMALDLLETDDETGQAIVVNVAPSACRSSEKNEVDGSNPCANSPSTRRTDEPSCSVDNRLFGHSSIQSEAPSSSTPMTGVYNKVFDDVLRGNLEPLGHQLPIGSPRQRRSPTRADTTASPDEDDHAHTGDTFIRMRTKRPSSSQDSASRDSFIDNLPKSLDEFAECESVQSQRRTSNQGDASMSSCPLSPSHTVTLSVTTNTSPSPPLDDDDLEVAEINARAENEERQVTILCSEHVKNAFYSAPSADDSGHSSTVTSSMQMPATVSGEDMTSLFSCHMAADVTKSKTTTPNNTRESPAVPLTEPTEMELIGSCMEEEVVPTAPSSGSPSSAPSGVTADHPSMPTSSQPSTSSMLVQRSIDDDEASPTAPFTGSSDANSDVEVDWHRQMNENNLQPHLIEDITRALGNVFLERPQFDYTTSFGAPMADRVRSMDDDDEVTGDVQLDEQRLTHVCEMHGFPASSTAETLSAAIVTVCGAHAKYQMKWVDDQHTLVCFSSRHLCDIAIESEHALVRFRSLGMATTATRRAMAETREFAQPYRSRPMTNVAMAKRLVETHLGKRATTTSTNERTRRTDVTNERTRRSRPLMGWDPIASTIK